MATSQRPADSYGCISATVVLLFSAALAVVLIFRTLGSVITVISSTDNGFQPVPAAGSALFASDFISPDQNLDPNAIDATLQISRIDPENRVVHGVLRLRVGVVLLYSLSVRIHGEVIPLI